MQKLDPKIVKRVQLSYGRCMFRPAFFDDFYECFIGKSPEVADKFANTDLERQGEVLRRSISQMLLFAGGSSIAERSLRDIRESHSEKNLNIEKHLYSLWLDSLIDTLHAHDPEWASELELDWREVMSFGIDFVAGE